MYSWSSSTVVSFIRVTSHTYARQWSRDRKTSLFATFLPSYNLVLDTVDRSVRSSNRRLRVSRRNRNGGELADKCSCHRQPSLHLRPVQGYLRRAFRFVEGIFFPSSRSLGNWTMRVDKRRDGSANLYRPLSRDDRCRDIHRGNGTLYRRLYALPASSFSFERVC